MSDLIDIMKKFNRKERFYLIKTALGEDSFCLSDDFREELKKHFSLEIPKNVFVAMDYHLDWIYASLYIYRNKIDYENEEIYKKKENKYTIENDSNITGTQQDIDLIIAFENNDGYHIILLEAKGVMSWDNKQMNCKAKRLGKIFGDNGDNWAGITPHFAIISREFPPKLEYDKWPSWMKPEDNKDGDSADIVSLDAFRKK